MLRHQPTSRHPADRSLQQRPAAPRPPLQSPPRSTTRSRCRAQGGIVFGPVRHLLPLFRDVVPAIAIRLERQSGCPCMVTRTCPGLTLPQGTPPTDPCNNAAPGIGATGSGQEGASSSLRKRQAPQNLEPASAAGRPSAVRSRRWRDRARRRRRNKPNVLRFHRSLRGERRVGSRLRLLPAGRRPPSAPSFRCRPVGMVPRARRRRPWHCAGCRSPPRSIGRGSLS